MKSEIHLGNIFKFMKTAKFDFWSAISLFPMLFRYNYYSNLLWNLFARYMVAITLIKLINAISDQLSVCFQWCLVITITQAIL